MKRCAPPALATLGAIRRIVVVRLKALGDIVLSLPVVYALREHYPYADIRYLCRRRYAEALAGETGLDGVIELPRSVAGQLSLIRRLRRERIDLMIDLLSSPRSALITRLSAPRVGIGMDVGRHTWCYHSVLPRDITRDGRRVMCYTLDANREIVRLLGLKGRHRAGAGDAGRADRPPSREDAAYRWGYSPIGFPAAEREREWARSYLDGLAVDRASLVGLAPAATSRAKSWPIARFIELAGILVNEMNLVPMVLWGPGEKHHADAIAANVAGTRKAPETGIARLGALIAELRLLVTLDSGPKHLAVVQGVPTVTLFGPTDPRVWDPMTDRHRVVYHETDGAPGVEFEGRATERLAEITPREVADAVAGLIADLAGESRDTEREVHP